MTPAHFLAKEIFKIALPLLLIVIGPLLYTLAQDRLMR
ncbi:MAG: hypothetical protein H6Q56_1211, partial [Deltaproteobacteria bacterium]|nr:hypothetical protein [Deltaproteobacteria bacterium]